MEYDAVIVGAGPAGLMAAKKIAKKGFSVLILERDRDLGTRTCAEAVSSSAFKTAEISPSPSLISNNVDGAYVYPPDEGKVVKIYGLTYKGYILNKPLFLCALASEAVSAGSDLQMRSEVKRVVMENGRARSVIYEQKGETKEVSFKVLIGADGVGSVISRECGFGTEGYELIPTIQYVMVNCNIPETGMIRIYMGNEVAPLGYAWVFAKNEYMANVGIGVRGKAAKPYLDKFVANHPDFFKNAKVVKEGGGAVPVGGQLKEVVKGNVLICGDSSGQVIPITGGGIRTSMAAGSVAGEAVSEGLESKNLSLLEGYPANYNKYWGSRIKQSLRVVRALEKLNDDDFNLLGDLLNGDDVVDLANGLNVKRVISKLMRHPVAAVRIASVML
jgi:digeranylgeranylglycerophospholipid reductase